MNPRVAVGIGFIILLLTGYLILFRDSGDENTRETPSGSAEKYLSVTPTQLAPRQAAFAIYTHGTFRIFTSAMYHNRSPDAYIEERNPNIVIVKKPHTTWSDFFGTLPFSVTQDCLITGTNQTFCSDHQNKLRFFLNGTEKNDLLQTKIQDGDRALITYGTGKKSIQDQLNELDAVLSK